MKMRTTSRMSLLAAAMVVALILMSLGDGTVLAEGEFAGGAGTLAEPWLIATPGQLASVAANLSSHFRLEANIDLGPYLSLGGAGWNDGAGWVPIGTIAAAFTGSFDGNGKTISNLFINRPGWNYVGLFGRAESGASIQNVELVGVDITGDSTVGGLVGVYYGTITDCSAQGTVKGNPNVGGGNVGGLVGNMHGSIDRSHAECDVTGSWRVGGLAGSFGDGLVSGSYAAGAVKGTSYVGGLVGYTNYDAGITGSYATGAVSGTGDYAGGLVGNAPYGNITKSYATGAVSGKDWVGGLAGSVSDKVDESYATGAVSGTGDLGLVGGLVGEGSDNRVTGSYYVADITGQPNNGLGEPRTKIQMQTPKTFTGWAFVADWGMNPDQNGGYPFLRGQTEYTGYVDAQFAGGKGDAGDPYQVATAWQLNNIKSYLDRHFVQVDDIDMDVAPYNEGQGWEPIGTWVGFFDPANAPFTGRFEGNQYSISGLTINRPGTDGVGLFSNVEGGTISNAHLVGVAVTGKNNVGGLVGHNLGEVARSSATGVVSGTNSVGGLMGSNYDGDIESCYAAVTVNGVGSSFGGVGGLVGSNYNGEIAESYATGAVAGISGVGGLAGYCDGDISDSYATGAVAGTGDLGGLVGQKPDGTVTASYYDTGTTGQSDTGKGAPKATAEMKQQVTFEDWDFVSTWRQADGYTYPALQWQNLFADEAIALDTVALIWDAIRGANIARDSVIADLILPEEGDRGSTISWTASPVGFVDTDTGEVTRPLHGQSNQTVALTATVSKEGGTSLEKEFCLTIMAESAAPGAPSITEQPSDQTVTEGQIATLTVVASGAEPLSFQWKKDGSDVSDSDLLDTESIIAGSATAGLTVTNVQVSDAGEYSCEVSNEAGDATSDAVTLTVNPVVPDNTAPTRSASVPAEASAVVTVNTAYDDLDLSDVFVDADGDTLTYRVAVNGGDPVVLANGNYSYTPSATGTGTLLFWAHDGTVLSTDTYTVNITILPAPSGENDITAFTVEGQVGDSAIDTGAHTVKLHMPHGTDVTALTPDITVSAEATVDPVKETPRDFSSPLTYTVTAQDGTKQVWTVTCIIDPEVNTPPARKAGVPAETVGGATVNKAYILDLSAVFVDADGDTLEYEVAVNGEDPVWAEEEEYSFTPSATGTVILVFGAHDGKADSTDTYTVTLTVFGSGIGFAGGTGEEGTPWLIATPEQLASLVDETYRDSHFRLMADINLHHYLSDEGDGWDDGAGWQPIGTWVGVGNPDNDPFSGSFDGNGKTISNLFINRPGTDGVGLFGCVEGATIQDARLVDVAVTGKDNVGGLVGHNHGEVAGSYVSGAVSGSSSVGGLIGYNFYNGSVAGSSATIAVSGGSNVGGLVGSNSGGSVTTSYTEGTVGGTGDIGGLVGNNDGDIADSYTAVAVTGTNGVGGLVGVTRKFCAVTDSYAAGAVSGSTSVGGLVGFNEGAITCSYYNSGTTGQSDTGKGEPRTMAQMKQRATFEDWDFGSTWRNADGYTCPVLQWQGQSVDEQIALDTVALTWGVIKGTNSAEDNVTADLNLPTAGVNGSTISWSASDASYVNAGTGKITRPLSGQGNETVTLTATVSKDGGTSQTKVFLLTIVETPSTSTGGGSGGGIVPPPTPNADSTGKVTAKPELDKNTGVAAVEVDNDTLAQAFGRAAKDSHGTKTVEVSVPELVGASAYELTLPASSLTSSDTDRRLEVQTGLATVTLPGNMLAQEGAAGSSEVSLTIAQADLQGVDEETRDLIGDRPVLQLSLEVDGKPHAWSNENAPVTVSIPYTPTEEELLDPEHIVVWYIDGSGNAISVPSGSYDPVTGTVTFTTTHFSCYAVAYVHKTFDDLGSVEWARESIEILASKGITNGVSESTYVPEADITRADYLVLLARTLGLAADFAGNFDDVEEGAYYYEAVGVAKVLGITTGSGDNLFNPGERISRQDMMVMTARALEKCRGLKPAAAFGVLDSFIDKADIADYAAESLATLVNEGLITGSGDTLDPLGNATRAEAAAFLYRIYSKY